MADRAQQLPGERLLGQLGEQLFDRPEANREVVAMVPVAEDGVESGQRGGVAIDDLSRPRQAAPERRAVDQLRGGFGRG
jgi:hypothetical protein